MNKDIIEGKWKQVSGKVRETWGKLTDDDMTKIGGSTERLSGKLQERYGWKKDEADKKVTGFLKEHGFDKDDKSNRPPRS